MASSEQELFYAEHLMENINNEEMISLPISSVHRILNIYKEKNGMDIKEKDKIGSFLSRYFKAHGENSVLLFLIFNISNLDYNYFDLFLTYCSDSFDYLSIQKLLIKTIIDLTNVTEMQKVQINECNENIKSLNKQIIKLKKRYSDQNAQIQQNLQDQLLNNNKYEKEINDLKNKLNQFIKEYDDKTKFKYKSKDDFEFNGKNKFDGIINSLSKKCNGNVHRNGIVNVTASSIHNSYLPQYIVELKNCTNYFHSQNQPNSWIQYDFNDFKVRPTAYSIRTRHDYGRGHNHPKNWCIEGSNDRINWTVLDLQSNITFLDGTNLSHTFNIKKDLDEKECYRYLRYRLTGVETQGNYKLVLSALEFFGSLILI